MGEILKLKANPKQYEAWRYLNDNTTNEILYGGAKYGGKSFLGCWAIFTWGLSYPGTFYFIARKDLNDLRKYTTASISELFDDKHWNIPMKDICRFNGQDSFYELNNGSKIFLLSCKHEPSDPLYQRFGSMQHTGGWIEEAGDGVSFEAYENLKLSIGRWKNKEYGLIPKLLITCNPKKNWLKENFYNPYSEGKLPPNKKFIEAKREDNIYGDINYANKLHTFIKDEQTKKRLIYGDWDYEDDPNILIEYEQIIACFTGNNIATGRKYISADVARYGSDKTVIIVWSGLRAEKIISLQSSSVTETARVIREQASLNSIPMASVIVDDDGIGGGVRDILNCKGFINNSSPLEVRGKKENFMNLKSQCYFKLAEKINSGEIFINCGENEKQTVIEELEQVKQYQADNDGKLRIIPKEKVKELIGRSPDYSDALMMRMWFVIKGSGFSIM